MKKPAIFIQLPAIRGKVLGVNVYRGFAKLSDLARMSRADVYDHEKNPKGTQRDLNEKHARDAYEYVKTNDLGFWPEVFLCARQKDVLTYTPMSDEFPGLGVLEINISKCSSRTTIAISRVDGNHRLHFSDGEAAGYSEIEKTASFCLAYDLNREEEIQLFRDINNNQKRMNTSHLDGVEARLTPEERLKRKSPDLYIAKKLSSDASSVLHGRVYEGGKKPAGVDLPLRGLKTGIEYMLSRSTQLPRLEDAEAQYRVIRNYFSAVKSWVPAAWNTPKEYIVLRGSGLWAMCFIGSQVIDRVLLKGKYEPTDMLNLLRSGKDWDWSSNGDFKGLGGRAGALEISKQVTRKLGDETLISMKALFEKIMSRTSE